MSRYKAVQMETGARPYFKWVILDKQLWDYCSLPDPANPSEPIPLEWGSKEGAEDWLNRCFRVWEKWETVKAPTPPGWQPFEPDPVNPFDRAWYDR